jgi:ribosomal protein L14
VTRSYIITADKSAALLIKEDKDLRGVRLLSGVSVQTREKRIGDRFRRYGLT